MRKATRAMGEPGRPCHFSEHTQQCHVLEVPRLCTKAPQGATGNSRRGWGKVIFCVSEGKTVIFGVLDPTLTASFR